MKLTKQTVLDAVSATNKRGFSVKSWYAKFKLKSDKQKSALRKILNRLCEDGVLFKVGEKYFKAQYKTEKQAESDALGIKAEAISKWYSDGEITAKDLAAYKPRKVYKFEELESLPRDPNGKLIKAVMVETTSIEVFCPKGDSANLKHKFKCRTDEPKNAPKVCPYCGAKLKRKEYENGKTRT